MGINKGNLSKCISGKYRSSGGFGWRNATPNDLNILARMLPGSQHVYCYSPSGQANPANIPAKFHSEGCVYIPTKAETPHKGATSARRSLKRRRAAKVFGQCFGKKCTRVRCAQVKNTKRVECRGQEE
jgi:hypothetical protein